MACAYSHESSWRCARQHDPGTDLRTKSARVTARVALHQVSQIANEARVLGRVRLAPAPGRRIRSAGNGSPACNSLSPRPIVLRAMPVARLTAAIPPRPAACASAAANRRRSRSSRKAAWAS
jgi:hypothetical protein